jgi:hypothetical protein
MELADFIIQFKHVVCRQRMGDNVIGKIEKNALFSGVLRLRKTRPDKL